MGLKSRSISDGVTAGWVGGAVLFFCKSVNGGILDPLLDRSSSIRGRGVKWDGCRGCVEWDPIGVGLAGLGLCFGEGVGFVNSSSISAGMWGDWVPWVFNVVGGVSRDLSGGRDRE